MFRRIGVRNQPAQECDCRLAGHASRGTRVGTECAETRTPSIQNREWGWHGKKSERKESRHSGDERIRASRAGGAAESAAPRGALFSNAQVSDGLSKGMTTSQPEYVDHKGEQYGERRKEMRTFKLYVRRE